MSERLTQFRARYERAIALLGENKDEEANRLLYEAAKLAPEGWLAVAIELVKEGHADIALERFREVLKLTQNAKVRAAALNNIGMILANQGVNAPAVTAFEEASRIAPEFPDTWSNLGLMRKWAGDYAGALRFIDKALARDPWHEQANFIKSMVYLLDGDYKRGFDGYECRWRSRNNGLAKVYSPALEWNGSNGKRLLVYGEQGHGDSLLVLRYAREIRARGLWQAWVCQKPLRPILEGMPEIDQVICPGDILPEFDCHLPAVSLPRVFGTTIDTIPHAGGYIAKPEPHDYGAGFHVGIVWRGSKVQGNDIFRSTRLNDWMPVLSVAGVTFHSLQVDFAEEALVWPQIVPEEKPADFIETAKRVAGLDLVISVDTSVVHLCGALGVNCWCALHCRPYFVFPPKLGNRTPWYDSVKLYRQQKEFEWVPVFEQIASDLCQKTQSKP